MVAADRQQYLDKCSDYQSSIDTMLAWENKVLSEMADDPVEIALGKVKLTNAMLDIFSYYLILNDISVSLLEKKNDDAISNARKTLTKAVVYLEEIVSPFLDAPYGDYQDRLDNLTQVNAKERYLLVRKLGLTVDLLKNVCGDNPKWKWMLSDLEGRFVTVAKNIFDLKNAITNTDPRSPNYEPSVYHLKRVKRLLSKAADLYREKYELVSNTEADFKKSIEFLSALRYIHSVLGESEESEFVKKKIDTWSAKLEADIKRKKDL
jgi:hypothetical protein